MRVLAALLFIASALVNAAEPTWIERVAPAMTAAEKKAYLALPATDRQQFEASFFGKKAITSSEYFERLTYIDDTFGSGRTGSGANTDPGRVYLSLGPPAKISKFASSRIFVPMEIWYYNEVPGVLSTELRMIFYRRNSVGFPRLYSPSVDTIRDLLLPTANNIVLFGPNDSVTESDIRRNLMTGPAEDEIVTAAVSVASGVKSSENDSILGRVASPEIMLAAPRSTHVTSKLILAKADLDVLQTVSPFGGVQVDLRLRTFVQKELDLEILNEAVTVADNRLRLKFPAPQLVEYTRRLDLLPGFYRLVFTIDGKPEAFPLETAAQPPMSEIVRVDMSDMGASRHMPFEFEGRRLTPDANGRFAAVSLPKPASVTWIVRQGSTALWKSTLQAQSVAVVELPANLSPGEYRLEANTAADSRGANLVVGKTAAQNPPATALSYNANLSPGQRIAFIGRQYLIRGNVPEARRILSGTAVPEARIELARADALTGNLDAAREGVRKILSAQPENFEALSLYAYIEAQLQDYPVAAELYRRALALQDSPALRAALDKIQPR